MVGVRTLSGPLSSADSTLAVDRLTENSDERGRNRTFNLVIKSLGKWVSQRMSWLLTISRSTRF